MKSKHLIIDSLNALKSPAESGFLRDLLGDPEVLYAQFKSLCVFDDVHYKRNRLAGSAWYDLWLICWKPGQKSPIHDHPGSECGFKILTGLAQEEVYRSTGGATCRLSETRHYEPGQICVAREQDIHKISNPSKQEALVTLHIYSPPLKMNYYQVEGEL